MIHQPFSSHLSSQGGALFKGATGVEIVNKKILMIQGWALVRITSLSFECHLRGQNKHVGLLKSEGPKIWKWGMEG